jgi:hypothetical protein
MAPGPLSSIQRGLVSCSKAVSVPTSEQIEYNGLLFIADTLALPNYTGSTGFGEAFIQAVIGQCGILDVRDCYSAVDTLVDKGIATKGKGKLFVNGTSHGGYLTAHRTFFVSVFLNCFPLNKSAHSRYPVCSHRAIPRHLHCCSHAKSYD